MDPAGTGRNPDKKFGKREIACYKLQYRLQRLWVALGTFMVRLNRPIVILLTAAAAAGIAVQFKNTHPK